MGNGKFFISRQSEDTLSNLMINLHTEHRPTAMKIAFCKGLASACKYMKQEPIPFNERGREVPDNVIATGFEYTLITHIMIEKEGHPISSEKDFDLRFRFYLEHGLSIIEKELMNLPPTENYLLYLVSEPRKHLPESRSNHADEIIELLGL